METTKPETEGTANAPVENAHDEQNIEEKGSNPSHEDIRTSSPDKDIEAPRETVDQRPKMTWRRFMAIFSLGCLLAAAQIPLYLIGGSLSYTVADIGGSTSYAWLAIANTLALAAVAPFAGAISDLIGRRYVALLGAAFVCIGMIIVGTAQRMDVAIGGMAIAGVGAGLGELVGASGIAELAPVKSRGKYIGIAFLLILPFSASAAYAQLYAASSTWRWGAWITLIINGGTFLMILIFYWPPPRPNMLGLSKREILRRIDYLGGFLSVTGFALFLLGLQWGGYQYAWRSAPVIVTMTLGLAMIVVWVVWENFAPYPMIPGYLFKNKRVSILTLFITALAGANFYSLLNFWPLECQTFYGPDPHAIARTVVAFGYAVALGVIIVDYCLSLFRGMNRELLLISSVLMTAGIGAMAAVNDSNPSLGIGMSFLGGFGVGGIIVPAAVILTIVSPDEVIATITAVTLSVRLIGGSIGYAIYFNVFETKLTAVFPTIVGTAVIKAGLPISELVPFLTALSVKNTTAIAETHGLTPAILEAAQAGVNAAYAVAFKQIYLVSIAFGGAAILSSLFLGDIRKYMVDRVAVNI